MKKITFFALCVCAVSGILLAGETASFRAIDDAYTDSVMSTSVYNGAYLSTQGAYSGALSFSSVQESYLKFDFGSIPQNSVITEVALGVYYYSKNRLFPYSTIPVAELYYVDNDNWDETSLTWENQPDAVDTSFASQQLGDFKYYEWDLLSGPGYQLSDEELADRVLSVMLKTANEDMNNFAYFYSDENIQLQPYLRVGYANPVPAPGALTLAMLGVGSVLSMRKKKK